MTKYYLAVDIGASSGRHILGHLENGRLMLEEVYRFNNGMVEKGGNLCWDSARLFSEIKTGLKKCKKSGKIPVSVGIDTWGVDYALLDQNDQLLGNTIGYRDNRTTGMDQEVYKFETEETIYAKTGIQKQIFNTIFQLMSVKTNEPGLLEQADTMLMLPDYFHFLLTGKKTSEYTDATTTQLVNSSSNEWDRDLIGKLGFPQKMFLPLNAPGTEQGAIREEVAKEIGYTCKVVSPCTHDTGSAVMALPTQDDHALYISSGTWSLMGVESKKAICTENARKSNFTNEGGYQYRYRFLKNIMGLWMIQSVRHEYGDRYSFEELCAAAEKERSFASRVEVNDNRFLAPKNMQEEIRKYCKETEQKVPENAGQMAAIIYQSLADSYANTVNEIEKLTGRTYRVIHVVGGGAKAEYLNKLTAERTGRRVLAGPVEATAIGNLEAQMIRFGEWKDLYEARDCISKSFRISEY